jgi:hypothetical protein
MLSQPLLNTIIVPSNTSSFATPMFRHLVRMVQTVRTKSYIICLLLQDTSVFVPLLPIDTLSLGTDMQDETDGIT